MRYILTATAVILLFTACNEGVEDVYPDSGDTGDSTDTGNSGDSADGCTYAAGWSELYAGFRCCKNRE